MAKDHPTGESGLYDLGRSRQGQWPYGQRTGSASATPQDVLADRILADDDTGSGAFTLLLADSSEEILYFLYAHIGNRND